MVIDDLRHAWRRIRAKPGTVVAAATMLALGVGLTTAMFTIADALLLRPVPFQDADRLARVSMMGDRGGRVAVTASVLRAWRESPAFEAVESAIAKTVVIESASGVIARGSATVTPGLFQMLGVRPLRGRLFDSDEGADRVVISEDLWRANFGADPALLGREISIDGARAVVVGMVPSDFRFPSFDTVVWRSSGITGNAAATPGELPVAFARLSRAMPEADALRLATEVAHQVDPSTAKQRATAFPVAGLVLNDYYKRAVPLLFGGVALVFLVLCANVTSLLLVRVSDRRREFSMCSALGASRRRLLRQAAMESTMIGVIGAAAGVALAWLLVSGARGFLPEAFLLRTLNPLNVDLRAFGIASIAGLLATLATGMLPAWLATRVDSAESLKLGERVGTETRAARTVTRALAISEIALACALLIGATILVRSFLNLTATDRGLDSDGVVVATISLPSGAFADAAARFAMSAAVEAEIRRLPGVEQSAFSYGLPPDGGAIHYGDTWQSDTPGAATHELEVESYNVGPEFFELYRIPLLRGRTFRAGDTDSDVIIGERLAARLWPGIDPLGRSFRNRSMPPQRVIGVARETNHPSIDPRLDRPEFYRPLQSVERSRGYFMLSMRCGDVCPEGALIRQRLQSVSPAVNVIDVGPLDAEYFEQLAAPRAAAALGFVFAGTALVAAAGGLFSVLSYIVGRRRREFGIRAALGASRAQIRGTVLRDGLLVGSIGIAIGAIAGAWLVRSLSSLQYGVAAADPVSWSLVIAILAATTVAATWRPAAQASRVDPVTLLRE